MPEVVADILAWVVPALVVFGVTALAIAISVWAIRAARRSPRARSAADELRAKAGVTLVKLDDAVDELDLEVGLSGALYGGGFAGVAAPRPPDGAARARRLFRGVPGDLGARRGAGRDPPHLGPHPATHDRGSRDDLGRAGRARRLGARERVGRPRRSPPRRARLEALRATMGDPAALVAELSTRYAEDEWADAARAARAAVDEAATAERALATRGEDRRRSDTHRRSPISPRPNAPCDGPSRRRAPWRRRTGS